MWQLAARLIDYMKVIRPKGRGWLVDCVECFEDGMIWFGWFVL